MKTLATIEAPDSIKRFLDTVGLPSEPPRKIPARAPPQPELIDFFLPDEFSQIADSSN